MGLLGVEGHLQGRLGRLLGGVAVLGVLGTGLVQGVELLVI